MTQINRVAAAPFRAHLDHVSACSGVHWSVLALHAGVHVAASRELMLGADTRRVAFIPADMASRILALSPTTAHDLRSTLVSAAPAAAALRRLAGRGWSTGALAQRLRLSQDEVRSLLDGRSARVAALDDLRIRALRHGLAPGWTQAA